VFTDRQESALTSGGDCFDHWHSADRVLTHDDVANLQSLDNILNVSSDVSLADQCDLVIVDTSVSNVTLTLPRASNGREVEIMKNAPANYLSIKTVGTDKILGDIELRVYNYGTSLRFKAMQTGWIII